MTDKQFSPARLWPDPDTGPWAVTLEWAEIDGRVECVGVTMRSFSPDGTVDLTDLPTLEDTREVMTAALWRSVPIGSLINEKRRSVAEFWEPGGRMAQHGLAEVHEGEGEGVAAMWRPGRPKRRKDPDHFEMVADIYRAAARAGLPPTKTVQERLGPVSHSTAAKWVAKCRKLGLLPETSRGVPSAPITQDDQETER